jgi:sugar lactone lactonase YvrE
LPDPTCSVLTGLCGIGSSEYDASAPPVVPAPGGTLKAIACKSGVPNPSSIQSVTYDIDGPPGAPTGVAAPPVGCPVTTLAGGAPGYADGTGTSASFDLPAGLALDAAANVYVADTWNYRIRVMTPGGVVTTLAGSGFPFFADGTGTGASFKECWGIAVDSAGNGYISDSGNNRIRVVTPGGVVTTLAGSGAAAFADGIGAAASFAGPKGVATDGAGNVYVADSGNHRIRKVTSGGVVTTLAGSGVAGFAAGTGPAASFNVPEGVAVDANGNVYVADSSNNRIRMVTPAGAVTTLAGSGAGGFADGTATAAVFAFPVGIAVDSAGNLYVADDENYRIRKLILHHGELAVTWSAPTDTGTSPITGYTATATAAGQTTQTCSTAGPTSCTISGLTTGVAYSVSVTATNASGAGAASAAATATPN